MLYAGIDIGRDEVVAALVCDEGESVAKPRIFSNNATGFKRLQKWLERIGGGPYHLCMESTGVYGEKLAHAFLWKSGFTVSIINPANGSLSRIICDTLTMSYGGWNPLKNIWWRK